MATIVNTPAATESNSGMGFLMGAILLVALGLLFFYIGLPMMRNAGGGGASAPTVNIPKDINVNVDTPNQ